MSPSTKSTKKKQLKEGGQKDSDSRVIEMIAFDKFDSKQKKQHEGKEVHQMAEDDEEQEIISVTL